MAALKLWEWRFILSKNPIRLTNRDVFANAVPRKRTIRLCLVRSWRHEASNPIQANGNRRRFLKPLAFTCLVGTGSFAGATLFQYERVRYKGTHQGVYSENDTRRTHKEFQLREMVNRWWNNLHEGQKVAACIIAVNIGVFLCWQIPNLKHFMSRWFVTHPWSRRTSPMLWSVFSHSEIWHLACNMVVFWSFAPAIQALLGTEQFLAFYLTGGVVASLTSSYFKLLTRRQSFSLGASGALLAVLGAVCIQNPDSRLSIIFLPFFTFSAQTALIGIISLDTAGILFGWQLFDHAAHLGGVLFGLWYVKYGQDLIWRRRTPFLHWWHDLRQSTSKNN